MANIGDSKLPVPETCRNVAFIGHNQQGVNKDLAAAGQLVRAFGGSGNDYLRADDTGSNADRRFRLRDHWIHSTGDSPDQEFGGIYFTGLERAELKANAASSRFSFAPSIETQFTIRGGKTTTPYEYLYFLDPVYESQVYFFSPSPGRFVYWFGESGYRFIQTYYP